MEIKFAATPSGVEDNSVITILADEGERISVGDSVQIELTDESFTEKTIVSMRRWCYPKGAKRGKWKHVNYIENGENAEATIENIRSSTIQTTSVPSHVERKKWTRMICLTPFKEIHGGNESIYDYVEKGYSVPDKVIAYLRTAKPFLASPGIYEHPFKEGVTLLGPYLYTDDT